MLFFKNQGIEAAPNTTYDSRLARLPLLCLSLPVPFLSLLCVPTSINENAQKNVKYI